MQTRAPPQDRTHGAQVGVRLASPIDNNEKYLRVPLDCHSSPDDDDDAGPGLLGVESVGERKDADAT